MKLTKKGIHLSKKEKAAAVVVSAALIGAPYIVDNSNVTYATENLYSSPKPPTLVDKIGNLVVPLNGDVQLRNLRAIFGESEYSYFYVTSLNPEIAYNEPGYSGEGLLKIHPNQIGKATFTVTGYIGAGDPIEETFDVIVVDDQTLNNERNFDIRDVVNYATSREEAEDLLNGIGPMNSSGSKVGNTPPIYTPTGPNDPLSSIVLEVNTFHALGNLKSYFSDPNDSIRISVFENSEHGAARIFEESEHWYIEADQVGISTFTVAAIDSNGGVTTKLFQVQVTGNTAPTLNTSNPVVPFLNQQHHILNVTGYATLDLSELFHDASVEELDYQLEISDESNTVTEVVYLEDLTESSSHVSYYDLWNLFYDSEGEEGPEGRPYTISKITAYDSEGLHAELDCDIIFDPESSTNVPSNLEMYASNQAGASSLTIEPHIQGWFENSEHVVHMSTANYYGTPVVTPYFYNNPSSGREYIKFEAGTESDTSSIVKLYTAITESSDTVWYQNDIHVYLNSPNLDEEEGQNIDLSYLFDMEALYDEYDTSMLYIDFNTNFSNYVSMSTVASVTYSYEGSGSYVVTVSNISPTGTVLTIDPDQGTDASGSRVYVVPFIKPNGTD